MQKNNSNTLTNTCAFNSETIENVSQIITHIESWHYDELRNGSTVELNEILKVCARVWNVKEDQIKCRIKHAKPYVKVMQYSFLWAASFYSKEDRAAIAKFMPCQWYTVSKAIDRINQILKNKDELHSKLLQIIAECEQLSPGLICSNFSREIKFYKEFIKQYSNRKGDIYHLTTYQINKVAVKPLEWFNKADKAESITAYCTDASKYYAIFISSEEHARHLYLCQFAGYRFVSREERKALEERHPVCDRCIKKLNCGVKGDNLWRQFHGYNSCFQGAESNTIDPKLLSLPFYQPS